MKRSRFIAGLVVLVAAQICTTVYCRHRERTEPGRIEAVRAAEADAARVFARALVSELKHDPDFELRDRVIFHAKLRAIEDIRRARSSPQHVVMTLAKLDEISPTRVVAVTERRANQTPKRGYAQLQHEPHKHDQRQLDRRPKTGPTPAADASCVREQVRHDQRQLGRRFKTGVTLSTAEKLMRALDRQTVPRTLDEIGRDPNDYTRLLRKANTDQIF